MIRINIPDLHFYKYLKQHFNRLHQKTAIAAPSLSITVFLFLCLATIKTVPASTIDVTALGTITVLENGRKKPFDTFARNKLLQFSGKQRIAGKSALEWMAGLLLNPSQNDFDKVFILNDPAIAHTLGIPSEKRRRYSYAVLSGAIEKIEQYYTMAINKNEKDKTVFDREIIRLYSNLVDYRYIASTMTFSEPDLDFYLPITDSSATIPAILRDPHHPPSFLDMMKLSSFHAANMDRIQHLTIDSLSEIDKAIITITRKMLDIHKTVDNPPPHLIPTFENGTETWMSPWGFIGHYKSAAANDSLIELFVSISTAYRSADQQKFNQSVTTLKQRVDSLISTVKLRNHSTELLYNRINAFHIAKILMGISVLLTLITFFSKSSIIRIACFLGIASALVLCTTGIILRMIIMRHPPVTNLYETFIFVGWTTILIGLFIEFLGIRSIGLITASLTGFIFLHLAGRYAADGDTLGMLAAVLDSGFWLTTHIITIALGYAGCMGAGFIGHIYILKKLLYPHDATALTAINKAVYGVLAFGLLFTTIGTVTGGMWADQAWGRFWGWDPKENGALLIILWCTLLFHFRLSRRIADYGMAVGAIVAAILVMCTWIGVNLLGTGLHSYGFTASGAGMLFWYGITELFFLIGTGVVIFLNKNRKPISNRSTMR